MSARLALKSALVFFFAVLVGHFVFKGPMRPEAAVNVSSSENRLQTADSPVIPVMQTNAAVIVNPPSAVVDPFHKELNREFKKVAGGFCNENVRMATTLSDGYLDGIEHVSPMRNQKVSWKPAAQEIRQGNQVIEKSAPVAAEARLDDKDGLKHVVYPSTYANTDEHLYVRSEGGIEHDIILKKQPAIAIGFGLAFSGYLTLGQGMTMWDDKTQINGNYSTKNGIAFKDQLGNPVFFLRPPVAFDAEVTARDGGLDREKQGTALNQRRAIGCEYQITFDNAGLKLAVVTPGTWLLEPERIYPVTIDPNFGPAGLQDSTGTYVGAVGNGNSFIPLAQGGGSTKITSGMSIAMPFPFTYYGINHAKGSLLTVNIDGYAGFAGDPVPDEFAPFEGRCFPLGLSPGDATSGIYYTVNGAVGAQQLILEWHNVSETGKGGNTQKPFSFNLILFECTNNIGFIVGDPAALPAQIDSGGSFIGIVGPQGAPNQVVQYENNPLNFDPANPRNDDYPLNPCKNNTQGYVYAPILAGTSLNFSVTAAGNVTIALCGLASSCVPFNSCIQAITPVVPPTCGQVNLTALSFHWDMQDGSEAFTQKVNHIYNIPGFYTPTLKVTDAYTNVTTTIVSNPVISIYVCDIPPVLMTVSPQGGTAPLKVSVQAQSVSPFVEIAVPAGVSPPPPPKFVASISAYSDATTAIQVDQAVPNLPGQYNQFLTVMGGAGQNVNSPLGQEPGETIGSTVLFDTPGTYRLESRFPATSFPAPTDVTPNTTGVGTVFIDVADPNSVTNNALMITSSNFVINWAGKIPNAVGVAPSPASDTITVNGYINLSGYSLSTLAGQIITIGLNGFDPIFQGPLDVTGVATQGDPSTGSTGTFKISLPSGKFTCTAKGDYGVSFGLQDQNALSLITANYKVSVGNIFGSIGTSVSYGYMAHLNKTGQGSYQFGRYFTVGSFFKANIPGAPDGLGLPGGQELLVSGGFLVTSADFVLQGDTVTAKINGMMARAGGDDLRPAATSNVIVKIGNFSETLNFSTSPTFKTTGKAPSQVFTFKSKGGTSIKSLFWTNKQGNFQIVTNPIPNAQVGINSQKGTQPIGLSFSVTPDSNAQFIGTTNFDITKVSDTEFKH